MKAYEIKCKTYIKRKELSNLFFFKSLYPNAQLSLVNIESAGDLTIDELKTYTYFEI